MQTRLSQSSASRASAAGLASEPEGVGQPSPGADPADRLERLLAVATEGLWEFDRATGLLFCSDRLKSLLGLPQEQTPVLRQLWRLPARDARRRMLRALRASWLDGCLADELFSLTGSGGRKAWFRLRARALPGGRYLAGTLGEVSVEMQAERELMHYRALMDCVVESLPMPVSVKDEAGLILFANETFCRMFGFEPGTLEGRRAAAMLPGPLMAPFTRLDRLAIETGVPQTLEDWFEPRVGAGMRFLRLTTSRHTDREGRRVVITVYEDQSAVRDYAKRMRELSMHVEAFVQRLLRTLPHPVYIKDQESRYLMANDAFAEQWDMKVEDIIGRSSRELFGHERGDAIEEEDARVLAGERIEKQDLIVSSADGSKRHWRVTKGRLEDVDGRMVILGSHFEITERVRSEIWLREALDQQTELRNFLQQVFDAMPDPVCVKNAAHRFVMCNQALAELLGVERISIIGRSAMDFFDPALAARFEQLESVVQGEGGSVPEDESFVWRGADGRVRHFRMVCRACHGGDGTLLTVSLLVDVTERLEHEAKLRRVNRFMQDVFDAIPNPIAVKNRSHVYVMANRALAEAHGLQKEALLGRTTRDFNPPDLADETIRADDVLFATGPGVTVSREIPQWYADGLEHRILLRKVVCLDPDGEPLIIASNSDVTELTAKEAALRESLQLQTRLREFTHTVFDMLPLASFVKDESLRYLMCNQVHARFIGIEPGDIIGHRVGEFMAPELAAAIEAMDRELLEKEDGCVRELEMRLTDAAGRMHDLKLHKMVARGMNGQRVIIGINQDLTALREAERSLRMTLERLDTLVRNAPLGIGRCHADGRFQQLNPLLQDMLGCARQGGAVQALPGLYDLVDCAPDLPSLRAAASQSPVECLFRRLDGSVLHVLFSAVLLSAGGDEEGFWVLLVDQSERRAADAELRRHRDQLRELVIEQTADLLNAKENAERANAAKSDFLAHVSHELRTPLHAMLGFARLGDARCESLPAERLHHYFGRVADSGERLLDLLDALLDLTKLEAGRMHLELRPVSPVAVIDEVLREFEALFAAHGLQLVRRMDADLPLIALDATRMGQVVRNLVSNAAKFAPCGSCITISCWREGASGAAFSVADEGPGIPAAELESVFDKFAQSSRTRSATSGTGLGLAICREIVTAHHGGIVARNRTPGGCEIVVTLPQESDTSRKAGSDEEHS